MDIQRIGSFPFLAASALLAVLGPLASAQVTPTWRLLRPSMTGIPGDYVQAINVDEADHPYIAAYIPFWEEGGLGHFDGTRWSTLNNVDSPLIGSPRFNEILKGPDGWIWIASNQGLLHYNPAVGPSSLERFDRQNTTMPGDHINDIEFAPDGTLWLAIATFGDLPAGGLVQFNPTTHACNVWTTANGITWGAAGGDWVGFDGIDHLGVVPDAQGTGYTVWFNSTATLGMGSLRSGVFTWHGNPQDLPVDRYPIKFLTVNPVDTDGNLWLQTSEGLAKLSRDGVYTPVGNPPGVTGQLQKFQPLRNGRAVGATFSADVFIFDGETWQSIGNWGGGTHTYALAEDSLGNIWAGGIGGAAYFDGFAWQRHRLTNTSMMSYFIQAIDFAPAPDSRVYINGNAGPGIGGFNIFDGTDWVGVDDANYGLGPVWGMPTDDVQALSVRPNGHVLIAPANQGLFDWDGANYTTLVPLGTALTVVTSDGLGRAWAAGHTGGLYRQQNDGTMIQVPWMKINTMARDPLAADRVWICNADDVSNSNGSTTTTYPRSLLGLTQNTTTQQLTCMAPAHDGTVWIGSYSGLFRFNPATSAFTKYTTANSGLPSNSVNAVHVATDGTLWIATRDDFPPYVGGLTHFDGTTWTTYSPQNSPLKETMVGCLASRSVNGGYELWVGLQTQGIAVLTMPVVPTNPRCQPADIADDQGNPLPSASPNNGVNEGDYNAFFQGFFDAALFCDIADDQGSPLAPFGPGTGVNNGVNEGDYNCFFQFFFNGCP